MRDVLLVVLIVSDINLGSVLWRRVDILHADTEELVIQYPLTFCVILNGISLNMPGHDPRSRKAIKESIAQTVHFLRRGRRSKRQYSEANQSARAKKHNRRL